MNHGAAMKDRMTADKRLARASAMNSLPCRLCGLLALGSWTLLCLVDLSAAWWSDLDAARLASNGVAVVALVLASVASIAHHAANACASEESPRSGKAAAVLPSTDGQADDSGMPSGSEATVRWAVAAQGALLAGSLTWFLLHAAGGRSRQAWFGVATLYTLTSLTVVQCTLYLRGADAARGPQNPYMIDNLKVPGGPPGMTLGDVAVDNTDGVVVDQAPKTRAAQGLGFSESQKLAGGREAEKMPEPGEVGQVISPTSKIANARQQAGMITVPVAAHRASRGRWKPLFKDPTFRGTVALQMAGCPRPSQLAPGGKLVGPSSSKEKESRKPSKKKEKKATSLEVQGLDSRSNIANSLTPSAVSASAFSDVSMTVDDTMHKKMSAQSGLTDVSAVTKQGQQPADRQQAKAETSSGESDGAFSDVTEEAGDPPAG
eukprot:TRINITY_DN41288_c0_g1_i1.p1 TRINITY_DN41288_c0_g1~~TRINITY_DN41288_c0_g1_i1.p1  ORF type:complete len:433 (-),score=77.16 TRINITY_DN41288_c0_g1_i1:186-1484(-)